MNGLREKVVANITGRYWDIFPFYIDFGIFLYGNALKAAFQREYYQSHSNLFDDP
jgi:hypothetical protein